jgi:sulfide:quinone oxidoreductase
MERNANPVLIAGGGIAALEAALAVRELGDGVARITMIAPEDEFVYRPLLVREPFSPQPADRRSLRGIAESLGVELVVDALAAVDTERRSLRLDSGEELRYGSAVIAVGARMVGALPGVRTLWVAAIPDTIDQILDDAAEGGRLNLIVPPGVTWPLPLYEFALMAARRLRERDQDDVTLAVVSPEQSPLIIFGPQASAEVAELLDLRGIEFVGDTWVSAEADGSLRTAGGHHPDLGGASVALPVIEGRAIDGLPADEHGFIPIDDCARVRGLDDVYAAGDGTNFPIKQGGIATQQADAAAEQIAARLGAPVDPAPFEPVLRGTLLTGGESVHMRADVRGGAGEGMVSSDYLWWPPHKVSGRYLAPFLAGESLVSHAEPPARSIEVEVGLPREWHQQPLGFGEQADSDGD